MLSLRRRNIPTNMKKTIELLFVTNFLLCLSPFQKLIHMFLHGKLQPKLRKGKKMVK